MEFAKRVGIETIVTSSAPEALADLDKLAGEFGVNVAFEGSNPKNLVSSLDGRSSRIGLSVDTAAWAQAGVKPTDALRIVNDRLLCLTLHDPGATGTEQLLLNLAKLNPPLPPPPPTCGDCAGPRVPVRPLFVTIGASAADAAAFENAVRPAVGWQVVQISKKTPISDGRPGSPSAGSPAQGGTQVNPPLENVLPALAPIKLEGVHMTVGPVPQTLSQSGVSERLACRRPSPGAELFAMRLLGNLGKRHAVRMPYEFSHFRKIQEI